MNAGFHRKKFLKMGIAKDAATAIAEAATFKRTPGQLRRTRFASGETSSKGLQPTSG
jgi:hypothetical protein